MMNDRELLELAAKAAGMEYWVVRFGPRSAITERLHITKNGETVAWNPFDDDADVLRLAVDLNFTVSICSHEVEVFTSDGECQSIAISDGEDKHSIVRRAIVLAAAEIGRAMTTPTAN